MTGPAETTRGFLLRSVSYAESDRILTFFTADLGKITAYARGARKSQKRFGGALEPFALIELTLSPRRDKSMWHLTEASLLAAEEGMARDLRRLEVGARVLKIIRESLPPHVPDPALFAFVEELIGVIGRTETDRLTRLAAAAELKLLSLLGMAVGLFGCTSCGRPVPEARSVLFHPGRGGVVCTPCGGGPIHLSAEAISGLKRLDRAPLEAAAGVEITPGEMVEIRGAIDAFIEHHLTGVGRL